MRLEEGGKSAGFCVGGSGGWGLVGGTGERGGGGLAGVKGIGMFDGWIDEVDNR